MSAAVAASRRLGGPILSLSWSAWRVEPDPGADGDEARTLRPLQAAVITYRIAFSPRAGKKVLTLRRAMAREGMARQLLCSDIDGFSLHAAVRVQAFERRRLGRLCRYITRPALSDERVQFHAAGQVARKRKTPWRDGTTHLVMSPLAFMQRLAALLPWPRTHHHLSCGAFASNLPLEIGSTAKPHSIGNEVLPASGQR